MIDKAGGITPLEFKAFCKAIVLKTQQGTQLINYNRESKNRAIHVWTTDYQQRCKGNSAENSSLFKKFARTIKYPYAKIKKKSFDPDPVPHTKINQKWNLD